MEKGLFRKKSLAHIASPEQMHDYMRVTTPRLWMLLTTIAVMLAGFFVIAAAARIENTVAITVQVEQYEFEPEDGTDGEVQRVTGLMAVLPNALKDQVEQGMLVRLDNRREGRVSSIGVSMEGTLTILIDTDETYIPMPEGEYEAELVLETTTPISFLWK